MQPGEIGLDCPGEAGWGIGETLKAKLWVRLTTRMAYEEN
jgi:hypothetical protein